MTDQELKARGWQEVGEHWFYPCDPGFMHQRAHTRQQAIQRTTKAVLKQRRLADVWILPSRSTEDGIEMGFIHPPRVPESEILAFIDTIPESALPHLSEADIEREYRHHYGEP
jgi:hypothetical protein